MATFGFDTTLGFVNPTDQAALDWVTGIYQSVTGITIDQQQPSVNLDIARQLARMSKGIYDDMAGVYASGFVGSATGAALANLLVPYIGQPLADLQSTVTLPLTAAVGPNVNVSAGSTVILDSDGEGALAWTLVTGVVIPGGGSIDGVFRYAEAGPKSAPAASTWTITTAVAGWISAGPNVDDASQGRFAETPNEYRQRFRDSALGGVLLAAVRSVPGVTNATLFENWTDVHDAFWGATHWIELLVQGGDNQAIADAIQATRCFTVQTVGNQIEIVVADGYATGTVTIKFSRPILVDVWLDLTITKGEDYSTDTSATAILTRENAIKAQIVAWGATRRVGLDAYADQAASQALITPSVPGIGEVDATIGLAPAPVGNLVVAEPRELLVFDAARITITGA